ncbi:major histocompatibility complex class I-related protein 1-like [Lissotriton helveticus]
MTVYDAQYSLDEARVSNATVTICSRDVGSHFLSYSFSFLSEPLIGVPQYSVVGYVDDVPIIGYTSESGSAGPRAPWMERITDEEPQYWEESGETFEEVKEMLNDSLKDLMEQKNQPMGLHVFQTIAGCELRDDGTAKWVEQYAYDGSRNATLDQAVDTENRGNSEELIDCIQNLKYLLKYGEESLLRKVAPQTSVSQTKTGNHTFLIGYAYGFYPREIEVKWVRNNVEMPWKSSEILPNPDGTYQVRTTVEVQKGDDVSTYEYNVNHISLLETKAVMYGKYSPVRTVE